MFNPIKRFKIEFYVGALVLVGIALLFYASLRLMKYSPNTKNSYSLYALFDNATGLKVGSAVSVAGIRIGEITDIELAGSQAKVSLSIYNKYVVYSNATAAVASIGILGDKYIKLTTGDATYSKLKSGGEIRHVFSTADIDSLIYSATNILQDMHKVSQSLYQIIASQKGHQRIDNLLDNVEALTGNLNQVLKMSRENLQPTLLKLYSIVNNMDGILDKNKENISDSVANFARISKSVRITLEENQAAISDTIKNLDTLVAILAEQTPELADNVNSILADNRENLQQMLDQIKQASKNLNGAMSNINDITGDVKNGQGTVGKLLTDDVTVEKLNKVLDEVDTAINPVNRLQFDVSFDSVYLMSTELWKSQINVRIQPARDHFYEVGFVQSPNSNFIKKMIPRQDDSGKIVPTPTWEAERDYSFNLMIAQRYFDTQIKIGLKEGKVGASLAQFFGKNDAFNVKLSLWDLSREDLPPQMEFNTQYVFLHNFYMNAGMDDILNGHRDTNGKLARSFYVGLGIRFTEDYLKSILGLALTTAGTQ